MAKIRINMTSQSLAKIAGLISNSILLGANAYLAGSSLNQQWRSRKREQVYSRFQMAAEVAAAAASLTKVIMETLERHRGT